MTCSTSPGPPLQVEERAQRALVTVQQSNCKQQEAGGAATRAKEAEWRRPPRMWAAPPSTQQTHGPAPTIHAGQHALGQVIGLGILGLRGRRPPQAPLPKERGHACRAACARETEGKRAAVCLRFEVCWWQEYTANSGQQHGSQQWWIELERWQHRRRQWTAHIACDATANLDLL